MNIIAYDPEPVEIWMGTFQFRFVVPTGTTDQPAKLQQLWQERGSGKMQWRTIPTEVVSNSVFHGL